MLLGEIHQDQVYYCICLYCIMGAVYKPKDLSKNFRKKISTESIKDIVSDGDDYSTENSKEEKD